MAQLLLVDDEKLSRVLYSDYLTGAGHQVTVAEGSREARALLEARPFDLVVTDLLMPETDGLALLELVRSQYPDVPVVLITALDKVQPAVRALRAGAADYLVKPLAPETLAHSVSRALSQRALLRENSALRRHIGLMEAGQRISSTIDRETLLRTAGAAFGRLTGASATLLFARGPDGIAVVAWHGVPDELAGELKAKLETPALHLLASADRHGQYVRLEALPSAFGSAYLVPAYEGTELLGAALLLGEALLPDEGLFAAPFLAAQYAVGLKNVSRVAAVEDLVYLDDLTHLYNARYLDVILTRELQEAAAARTPFSLLFLDLDYFKSVNDTHGHLVGSKLLVEISRVIKNCIRDNDVAARWGGDEYVLLLRKTDSGGALKVAERIRRSIEEHRFLAREGYSLHLTTCVGVASYPEHGTDKSTLVDFADRAMYRGKKGQRNVIYMASRELEATPTSRHAYDGSDAAALVQRTPPTT